MLNALMNILSATRTEPLPEPEARLALAALLVRVARADGYFALAEAERIDRILASRYRLAPAEVADLRARAEALEAEAPDTVRFTRAIKEAVPHEDRVGVIEALWSVVMADGARDDSEAGLLRLLSSLLGVTDVESARARQRAAAAE